MEGADKVRAFLLEKSEELLVNKELVQVLVNSHPSLNEKVQVSLENEKKLRREYEEADTKSIQLLMARLVASETETHLRDKVAVLKDQVEELKETNRVLETCIEKGKTIGISMMKQRDSMVKENITSTLEKQAFTVNTKHLGELRKALKDFVFRDSQRTMLQEMCNAYMKNIEEVQVLLQNPVNRKHVQKKLTSVDYDFLETGCSTTEPYTYEASPIDMTPQIQEVYAEYRSVYMRNCSHLKKFSKPVNCNLATKT